MRLAASTVLALAVSAAALIAIGRSSERGPAWTPTAWSGDAVQTLGPTDAQRVALRMTELAPRPARTGEGLTFGGGPCRVTWSGDPRYGDWLYELVCDWPAEAPPAQRAWEPWRGVWPEELWAAVRAIDWCESRAGQHPDTYRLDLLHGGRLQIAQGTWRAYFEREYGWTWAQVVQDDAINFRAALVIYQRAGSFRPWPVCGRAYY